jgi:hypothetical protein
MNRRGFLAAILAAASAPAIVQADSLMRIFVPPQEIVILWGDGAHDDTAALQRWMNGGRVFTPEGMLRSSSQLTSQSFLISSTVIVSNMTEFPKIIEGCTFMGHGIPSNMAMLNYAV